ncbi:Co-chaperone Hsc20 [Panus rudis PR-1116 ss-1]|nr:Co-chaperone Hsc20 [Panus rudis PR-1116 ss-1]
MFASFRNSVIRALASHPVHSTPVCVARPSRTSLSLFSTAATLRNDSSLFPAHKLRRCPSCSYLLPTPLPVCPNCKHIEPVGRDALYHELLGFDYDANPFNVDQSQLRDRFRKAMTVVHPDLWAGRNDEKQKDAELISSILNTAYRTLSDPVQRVLYILRREGIPTEGENILDDPELIMEVMELRESIENAESQEEVDKIREENQGSIDKLVQEISRLIDTKDWSGVALAAAKLKYLRGIDDAARNWPNAVSDH